MPVPINEFDVSDAESSTDGSVVNRVSNSEVAEIDQSELIEIEEPPKIRPASPLVDAPLQATDEMLAAIEEMRPPFEESRSPVAEVKAVEPHDLSGTALAAGLERPNDTTAPTASTIPVKASPTAQPPLVPTTRPRRTKSSPKKKPVAIEPPTTIPLTAKTETGERGGVSPPLVALSGMALAIGGSGSTISGELPAASAVRPTKRVSLMVTKQQASVVQLKHERIVQLLKDRQFDGLLLSRLASIAWYTGGADVPRGLSGQTAVALLITPEGGTLLARKADRDLLLGDATADWGLQHRECAWPTEAGELLVEKLRTKKVASDQPFEPCADMSSEVAALRCPLRPQEIKNLRKLGIRLARTVERAAKEFQRGDTEAQIAGDVASRLIRHEVHPVRIQVWGDGRGRGLQNWSYGRTTVDHDCTISVVGRRHGMHVAVSRTVSFGIPSKELHRSFPDMLMAHATALTSSRDQTELSAVWTQVERVCETLGEADDWRATDPGCVTGYELCESPISAKSSLRLRAGMPVIWRSLIGPARAVDTILVREADSKVITQTGEWPKVGVSVNNKQFFVQTVLQRSL